MISIIIPTRGIGDFSKLKNLLQSLYNQTIVPEEILIIIDFDVAKRPLQEMLNSMDCFASLAMTKVICQDGYGVSAARNRGIKDATAEYVLLCDDDIVLQDDDILERMLDSYGWSNDGHTKGLSNDGYSKSMSLLYPTILFGDTEATQTQGFTNYNWFMCWPVPKYSIDWKSRLRSWKRRGDEKLQLIGSICVFAKTDVLRSNLYDEKFDFIYEDLEWSYRAHKKGIQIINDDNIQIQHREKQKDILAWSYIDKPDNVYRKTKHRIWFVLRHANWRQLIAFYCCGFWLSNGRTLMYILLYGKKKQELVRSWWKGIKDGLKNLPELNT